MPLLRALAPTRRPRPRALIASRANATTLIAALALAACGAPTAEPHPRPALVLRAEGEVETAPDMASFRVELACLRPRVTAAKDCLVEESQALEDALTGFGVSPDDLQTQAVTLNKSYSWRNNSQVFEGYQAATALTVTVRDLGRLDGIYTELLENRRLEIGPLSYSHSRIDSLSDLAHVCALARAEALGDALVAGLDTRRKTVVAIGNVDLQRYLPGDFGADAAYGAVVEQAAPVSRASRGVAISEGLIKIKSVLEVAYRLD